MLTGDYKRNLNVWWCRTYQTRQENTEKFWHGGLFLWGCWVSQTPHRCSLIVTLSALFFIPASTWLDNFSAIIKSCHVHTECMIPELDCLISAFVLYPLSDFKIDCKMWTLYHLWSHHMSRLAASLAPPTLICFSDKTALFHIFSFKLFIFLCSHVWMFSPPEVSQFFSVSMALSCHWRCRIQNVSKRLP